MSSVFSFLILRYFFLVISVLFRTCLFTILVLMGLCLVLDGIESLTAQKSYWFMFGPRCLYFQVWLFKFVFCTKKKKKKRKKRKNEKKEDITKTACFLLWANFDLKPYLCYGQRFRRKKELFSLCCVLFFIFINDPKMES